METQVAKRKKRVIEGVTYVKDTFGCYVPEGYLAERVRIRKPKDAMGLLHRIRFAAQETLVALNLNATHEVTSLKEVTVGLVNKSQVHPRETFKSAILDSAVSVIIAHNHPSGSLEASVDDLLTTRRLVDAGTLLGIPILDHLIVSPIGFISLRERFPNYFQARTPSP